MRYVVVVVRSLLHDTGVGTDSQQRRKTQNRAAQRAYRLRKETHIQDLKAQLADMQNEHDDLSRLCDDQRQEIQRLNSCITKLLAQLQCLN